MEVFDATSKTIQKVVDSKNTWVQVPFQAYVESLKACVVTLDEENAFVALGGLYYIDIGR